MAGAPRPRGRVRGDAVSCVLVEGGSHGRDPWGVRVTRQMERLPGANDYCAWDTQPPPPVCGLGTSTRSTLTTAAASDAARAARVARMQQQEAIHVQMQQVEEIGDDSMVQVLMEQLGQTPTMMLGTHYSEKLAVDCDIPDEAGGNLSIMQDPGSEQRGHGEAGGVVWKCAAAMGHHLCDRRYFPRGYWKGKRCLEIGAGTGILGLAAARLGALVTITDYGELSDLIAHNVKRNLSPEQQAATTVDSFDWNHPAVAARFPKEKWDVILISDVVWADGYGRLPQTLTEIASSTTPIVLGFEQRAHKRPELASPTFIPTLHEYFQVDEVEFPVEHQREHLYLYHLHNVTDHSHPIDTSAKDLEVDEDAESSCSSGSDGFEST